VGRLRGAYSENAERRNAMNVFTIIGVVVVAFVVLGYFGLR
jgi:hypothetical protein